MKTLWELEQLLKKEKMHVHFRTGSKLFDVALNDTYHGHSKTLEGALENALLIYREVEHSPEPGTKENPYSFSHSRTYAVGCYVRGSTGKVFRCDGIDANHDYIWVLA